MYSAVSDDDEKDVIPYTFRPNIGGNDAREFQLEARLPKYNADDYGGLERVERDFIMKYVNQYVELAGAGGSDGDGLLQQYLE